MRATYRRGMQIKGLLDQKGINSFIPMRYEIHLKNGRRRRELVPVIRDIVFVHTTQSELQRIKYGIPYFQYMMDIRNGEKIIVPDEQMRRFIAVAGTISLQGILALAMATLSPDLIEVIEEPKKRNHD